LTDVPQVLCGRGQAALLAVRAEVCILITDGEQVGQAGQAEQPGDGRRHTAQPEPVPQAVTGPDEYPKRCTVDEGDVA
jgi:hypothetical protein